MNRQGRIVHFEEKPSRERLSELESEIPGYGQGFLASMGIYIFSREALEQRDRATPRSSTSAAT